jgi:hypothetical protein
VGREEERHDPPGERVVQVVREARLRARPERGVAERRLGKRAAKRRRAVLGVLGARLLERDVLGGVAHEQHRQEERDERNNGATGYKHVARRVLGREPAAHNGREGDTAIAS